MDVVELGPHLCFLRFPVGHAYLWRDVDGLTLIDTGLPGSAPLIEDAIHEAGFQRTDLRRLVLTHFHLDHVGAAAEITGWGEIEVFAHRGDVPFIRGKAAGPPPDLADWERPIYDQVMSQVPAMPVVPSHIDRELDGGDTLSFGDGAVAVAVPGHTPGSIALYLPSHRVLFRPECQTVPVASNRPATGWTFHRTCVRMAVEPHGTVRPPRAAVHRPGVGEGKRTAWPPLREDRDIGKPHVLARGRDIAREVAAMNAGPAYADRPPVAQSIMTLLESARHGLVAASAEPSPAARYVAAHLAALRAAAAVVTARSQPGGPRRRGPRSVWELLPRVAPALGEWAAFFAAGAAKRAAAEAGLPRAVSAREADDLLRDSETFLALVEEALGVLAA